MKDETRHAVAMLLVSVVAALAWLAAGASAEDPTLSAWPGGVMAALVVVFLVGLAAYAFARSQMGSDPIRAMAALERTWIIWAVLAGIVLAVPLVVAGTFPQAWTAGDDAALILRAVLAYVVVETIKLIALDGKWVSGKLEASAKALVTSGFGDQEIEPLSDKWLAVHSDDWQGGWGKTARKRLARSLSR